MLVVPLWFLLCYDLNMIFWWRENYTLCEENCFNEINCFDFSRNKCLVQLYYYFLSSKSCKLCLTILL